MLKCYHLEGGHVLIIIIRNYVLFDNDGEILSILHNIYYFNNIKKVKKISQKYTKNINVKFIKMNKNPLKIPI